MRRTLFHLRGQYPSYIENSSNTSPSLAGLGRSRGLVMAQKLINFSTLRGGKSAPETRAFQRRGGGGEPKGLKQPLFFGDGEGEGAMEHVARAQRVHGVNREGRRLLQVLVLVEPDRALRAPRSRQKRRGQLRNLFERLAVVGDPGGCLLRFAGKHQMRGGGEQAFSQRHGAVDIDDDRNAALAGLGAEIGAKLRAAILGQDSAAVLQQLVGIRKVDLP